MQEAVAVLVEEDEGEGEERGKPRGIAPLIYTITSIVSKLALL